MKKRLRLTVIALVTILLGSVSFLVGRSLFRQHQDDLLRKGIELIPGVSQHIHDFRRVKVADDGRKVWEVAAEDAQYFEADKTVVIREAMLQLFLKDGRALGLQGREGRLLLDSRELTRVELSGNIEVMLAGYEVRTDEATYDHQQRRISAPGVVRIAGSAFELSGDGMEIDIEEQRLTLLHHVSMRVEPALLRQEGGHDVPL